MLKWIEIIANKSLGGFDLYVMWSVNDGWGDTGPMEYGHVHIDDIDLLEEVISVSQETCKVYEEKGIDHIRTATSV